MAVRDLLFDTPWWLLALAVLGGAGLWYFGNLRMDKTIKRIGLIVFLAGLALIALNVLFTTDKQHVTKQTKQIVQAFVDRDWDKLQSMLPPGVNVAGIYNNRDALIAGGKKTVDTIGLKSATITSLDAVQNDTAITVDLTVLSTQDATMDRPMPSNWRFDWQNLGNGWMLERIEPLEGRQVSKNELSAHMAK